MRQNQLRALRRRLEFTQSELATAANCSRATVILIERLKHYSRKEVRGRLATALGISESTIWPTLEVANDDK